jgi:DNA primase
VRHLEQELTPAPASQLLEHTAAFYQLQLHRHPEATSYLEQRGLHDSAVIEELGIGYAPGGNLRRHLAALGYPFELLLEMGLINHQGRDAFCRRAIFSCRQDGQIVNLYGRSIGAAFPHRLLPRSKGGLFAWESVTNFAVVILVEGLFDLAILWQAGFRNTTCAIGTQLTPTQLAQLSDQPGRSVYIVFDQDENQAGQKASRQLALRLKRWVSESASSTCHTGMIPTATSLPAPAPPTLPPGFGRRTGYEAVRGLSACYSRQRFSLSTGR